MRHIAAGRFAVTTIQTSLRTWSGRSPRTKRVRILVHAMTRKRAIAILLTAVLALPASLAIAQESITLQASMDTSIYGESEDLSNGVGDHLFVGRTNRGEIRRALVAFSEIGAIGDEHSIASVHFTLEMDSTIAGDVELRLHRLLSQWGEGASDAPGEEGTGTSAETGDATWGFRNYDSLRWDTAGGDFDETPSATATVGATGIYTFGSTPELVADVEFWRADPSQNFGWIIVANESQTPPSAKRFASRENTSQAGPELELTFAGTEAAPINFGHSGGWFNAETGGQGILIEVLPSTGQLFLAWFTYEAAQKIGSVDHRWLTGLGDVQGNRVQVDLTATSGGFFDDPAEVTRSEPGAVGTVSLEFSACDAGTMTYSLVESGQTNSFPIERLGPAPEICQELASRE